MQALLFDPANDSSRLPCTAHVVLITHDALEATLLCNS